MIINVSEDISVAWYQQLVIMTPSSGPQQGHHLHHVSRTSCTFSRAPLHQDSLSSPSSGQKVWYCLLSTGPDMVLEARLASRDWTVSQRPRWRLGGGPVETSWRELSWEHLTSPETTSIIFSPRYYTDNCKYIFVRIESTFILYDVLTRKSHYSSNSPFSSLINVKLLDTFQELSLAITPRITHKQ